MKKSRWIGISIFLVLLIAWGFFYSRCGGVAVELFPERTFEFFPLNDSVVGGFSTSEVQVVDTLLTSTVVIHSGKAFTYAGVGFNLRSMDKRPGSVFDLTKFDSMEVAAMFAGCKGKKATVSDYSGMENVHAMVEYAEQLEAEGNTDAAAAVWALIPETAEKAAQADAQKAIEDNSQAQAYGAMGEAQDLASAMQNEKGE